MTDLLGLLSLIAPFFALIGLGIAAARIVRLPLAGLAWMQVFLVYLALPALFFRLLADEPIAEVSNGRFVLVTTLCTASVFALGFAAARWGGRPLPDTVIGAVSASYSNIGYMGPPLVTSFLGPAASAPVALIFVFDTLFLFTAVPALMALAGIGREPPPRAIVSVLRRVLLHPFMIATALGLVASLAHWRPPEALARVIEWLSGASAPCALFTLGVTVALQPVGRVVGPVSALAGLKLIAHPALVWLVLATIGGVDPVWVQAAAVMAALPPALNVFVLASQYRAGLELGSACVLVGTLASTVTLTAIMWLFRSGTLPVLPFGP